MSENKTEIRVVRKRYQLACALAVNLMMVAFGFVYPASSFLIPQLEESVSHGGFGISVDQGSWLGKVAM